MTENLTRKLPNGSNGKLDEVFQIIQAVRAELSDLRNTVETRLYDTRPIWEGLKVDIAGLQEGQRSLQEGFQSLKEGQQRLQEGQQSLQESQRLLKEGQDTLRGDVREIRTHLRDMDRRLSIFNDTLVGIQADYRDIYDRVREIERQRT